MGELTRTGAKVIGIWNKDVHLSQGQDLPLIHIPTKSLKTVKKGDIVDFTGTQFNPQKAIRKPDGTVEMLTDAIGNPVTADYKKIRNLQILSIKVQDEVLDIDPEEYEEL